MKLCTNLLQIRNVHSYEIHDFQSSVMRLISLDKSFIGKFYDEISSHEPEAEALEFYRKLPASFPMFYMIKTNKFRYFTTSLLSSGKFEMYIEVIKKDGLRSKYLTSVPRILDMLENLENFEKFAHILDSLHNVANNTKDAHTKSTIEQILGKINKELSTTPVHSQLKAYQYLQAIRGFVPDILVHNDLLIFPLSHTVFQNPQFLTLAGSDHVADIGENYLSIRVSKGVTATLKLLQKIFDNIQSTHLIRQ